jgi:hypothetical protein
MLQQQVISTQQDACLYGVFNKTMYLSVCSSRYVCPWCIMPLPSFLIPWHFAGLFNLPGFIQALPPALAASQERLLMQVSKFLIVRLASFGLPLICTLRILQSHFLVSLRCLSCHT